MMLSKSRASVSAHGDRNRGRGTPSSNRVVVPDFDQFLEARDYSGAIVLLQFKRLEAGLVDKKTMEWLAYCHFHHGDHDKALHLYKELMELIEADPLLHTFSAACLFYMGLYEDSEEAALKGPECPLQVRIMFHIAHRQNDEKKLMKYHESLEKAWEDQLSLASIHYLRSQYQEAIDIYKSIMIGNREWLALNVYLALCYYHLDCYDVSLEILMNYLQVHPDSALTVNLKACNNFKLYNGKVAQADLKTLETTCCCSAENELLQHNQVVFKNGEGALQILPPLVDILPEARLNLVIYHLQNEEAQQAYDIIKLMEPSTPQEYILKAVALASYGHEIESSDLLNQAQRLFHLVGSSASECDTIPGRQCMASCFILLKQFDDALIYLKSIKAYCEGQEEFNWNYGMAKAANGEYQEAEEILLMICSDKFRNNYHYIAWLTHCLIMNNRAGQAWEQYLQMESSDESVSLLVLIANESYKTGQYLFAAKAFDALEKMDESPHYWEGKRGACVGVLKEVVTGKEPKDSLREAVLLLRNTNHPQVQYIVRVMQKWAKGNGVLF